MLQAVTWTMPALAVAGVLLALLALIRVERRRRSRTQEARRRHLLHELEGSRLRRMLQLRHLDPGCYLDATSTPSLDLHLAICRECPRVRVCEEALRQGLGDSFWYCQNATMIERLLRDERRA